MKIWKAGSKVMRVGTRNKHSSLLGLILGLVSYVGNVMLGIVVLTVCLIFMLNIAVVGAGLSNAF